MGRIGQRDKESSSEEEDKKKGDGPREKDMVGCRESKTKLNKALREMSKEKIERKNFLEMKRKHVKLCREKQEEEKEKEQEKLLGIKDRN